MLDEGVEGPPGVPGARNAEVFGRICDALMLVTSAGVDTGGAKGGLEGVERLEGGDGGKSKAAAKQDITNPSVESEAAAVVEEAAVLLLEVVLLLQVALDVVVVVVVEVYVDVEVEVSTSGGRGGKGLLEGRTGVGGTRGVALLLL